MLHTAATALVCLDVGIRGFRLQAYAREAGGVLSLRDSLIATIAGDAAAALTPWRLAGEPMRVAAMRPGCSITQAVVALGSESAVNYLVVAIFGAWLGSQFGAEWWHSVGSQMAPTISTKATWWIVAITIAVVSVALVVLARAQPHFFRQAFASVRDALATALRASHKLLAIGIAFSAISLTARIALLPLLALDAAPSPDIGVLALVSFGLLYGQLVVPTPSGAGAVDAFVLGGATGVQENAGELLAVWRLYSTILPTIVGVVVAFAHFGPSAIRVARRVRDET